MKTPAPLISFHKLHHQFAQLHSRSAKSPMQQFSRHGAVARLCATAFIRNKPYPLSKQGFYGSPIARRKLRGVPRDGRAMAANHPARNPANVLSHIRATSRQWPDSGNGNATERPSRRLARQLALRRIWPRHVRAGNLRDDSPQISTMTFKNYEYTNHTNARS